MGAQNLLASFCAKMDKWKSLSEAYMKLQPSKWVLFGAKFPLFVISSTAQQGNTVWGNTKTEFDARNDCKCGRYQLNVTNSGCWILIYASRQLLNDCFFCHHWHWKHIWRGYLNSQYEQEEWLQLGKHRSVFIYTPNGYFKTNIKRCEPIL